MRSSVRFFLALIAAPLLANSASTAAAQSDVGRWANLYASVPPPPASLVEALRGVRGIGDSYGFRLSVSDLRMLDVKRELELLQSKLWAPRNQGQARSAVFAGIPLANTPSPGTARTVPLSIRLQIAPAATEAEIVARAASRPVEATRPKAAAMAAYATDLSVQVQEPTQRGLAALHAIRARYGTGHWDADQVAKAALRNRHDVAQLSAELVRTHHALAADELREATVVLLQARAAMAPQVERMAKLAREAEAEGASPSELKQAAVFINERVATLYQLHEQLLYQMGLWAGVQAVKSPNEIGDLYVHAHAPNVAVVPTFGVLYLGVWPYKPPVAPR